MAVEASIEEFMAWLENVPKNFQPSFKSGPEFNENIGMLTSLLMTKQGEALTDDDLNGQLDVTGALFILSKIAQEYAERPLDGDDVISALKTQLPETVGTAINKIDDEVGKMLLQFLANYEPFQKGCKELKIEMAKRPTTATPSVSQMKEQV